MTRQRRVPAPAMLVVGLIVGSSVALAKPRPSEYLLPGDDVFPDGIAAQDPTGMFFVSSTTDGTI